jgi:hypothetical protein
MWLNPSALPATNFDTDLFTQRQTSGNSDADFATSLKSTGILTFYASRNAYASLSTCASSSIVSTNTWSFFTAVVDNSQLKLTFP